MDIQTDRILEGSGQPVSSSTDAEKLLRALRNVIIPLARPADGEYKHNMNETTLGPDGKEFITALEKFMRSFLRSQQGPVGGIEVELEEEGTNISEAGSQAASNDDFSSQGDADMAPQSLHAEPWPDGFAPEENTSDEGLMIVSNEGSPHGSVVAIGGSTSISNYLTDISEQQKSRIIGQAQIALREHVFNTMPIRLLCFQPQSGSRLQITLIERGEIYARIASSLENVNLADIYVSRKTTQEEDTLKDYLEQHFIKNLLRQYSRYAILSHTWLRGESREIIYDDWIRGEFDAQQPGYRKLVNFCRTAWKDHGITFGWMDTICINKESSAELDESIRSMYNWYSRADVCITYLAETVTLADMPNDSWFTRGWTLQELLAPSHIKFYNAYWNKLVKSNRSDKYDLIIPKKIEETTTITAYELTVDHTSMIPISRLMQMAAKRQVTREEDSAYSLMGIFNVSIATAYGEGAKRAFSRLLQEVLNSSSYGVADIFNWAGPDGSRARVSCLLPSSLQCYLNRSSSLVVLGKPVEPIMLTHLGLRISILLMPAISIANPAQSQRNPFGNYHAITNIRFVHPRYDLVNGNYSVLDARISNHGNWNGNINRPQLTLGVLNVGDGLDQHITIPKHCLAVAFQSKYGSLSKVSTNAPITFTLEIHGPGRGGYDYYIKQSELESHGIKLVSMVL